MGALTCLAPRAELLPQPWGGLSQEDLLGTGRQDTALDPACHRTTYPATVLLLQGTAHSRSLQRLPSWRRGGGSRARSEGLPSYCLFLSCYHAPGGAARAQCLLSAPSASATKEDFCPTPSLAGPSHDPSWWRGLRAEPGEVGAPVSLSITSSHPETPRGNEGRRC